MPLQERPPPAPARLPADEAGERLPAPGLDLSVVIPSYLEEENLRVILPRLLQVLHAWGRSFEVLVVDTPKPLDDTRAVCEALGISYVAREGGDRYADAVRTGIARAQGKWILFMDGDGSHAPEFLPRMLEHMEASELVVASRYVSGGATENPAALIWMSWVLNVVYRYVLRIPCRDVSNSLKLYRAERLKGLTLECQHFDVIEEMLVKISLARPPPRVVEVPFVFKARMFGSTKRDLVTFMFSFAVTLGRLFWMKVRFARRS
jgi:dolichol-phosphate mannosyltransferase